MDLVVKNTKKLLTSPPSLTPHDLYETIDTIIPILDTNDPNNSTHHENMIKIASFLSCLRTTGLDHKAEYIVQAAKAVLNYSSLIPPQSTDNNDNNSHLVVMDIVGTGGDGQNTFNVSTSTAIVASGIPGIKIVKHGGKASTSNSGAGDLISALGCDVSKVNSTTVPQLWSNNSFLFLLAPYFHNGMKSVALIRKMMGIPTIFNVLGPLLHPLVSTINKRILGVYSKELGLEYARAASLMYPNNEIFVVWGHVGLDEISPIGKTTIWHVSSVGQKDTTLQNIETFEIEPSMFGLKEHPLSECLSLGPVENARILKNEILSGKYRLGDNFPLYDYILLNTAVLYCLSVGSRDWRQGVLKAEESIQSGNALKSLSRFIDDVKNL